MAFPYAGRVVKPMRDELGRIAAVPPPVRFGQLVDRSGGPDACWPWLAGGVNGYGTFRLGSRKVRAHRYAYVHLGGHPLPDDVALDHVCHDPETCPPGECEHRRCCNPAHLRPSTAKENNARDRRRTRADRTHCPSGHLFDEANTRHWRSQRLCRACQREQARARRVRVT